MSCQNMQLELIFADMESMVPENHLLRKPGRTVALDFICDLPEPHYPAAGRFAYSIYGHTI